MLALSLGHAGGDPDGLALLATELEGIARYRPRVRERAAELARTARERRAAAVPPTLRAPPVPTARPELAVNVRPATDAGPVTRAC